MHQVTIYATITTSTPGLLTAIINHSEPPTPPTRYPFPLTNSNTMGSSSALRPIPPPAARDAWTYGTHPRCLGTEDR